MRFLKHNQYGFMLILITLSKKFNSIFMYYTESKLLFALKLSIFIIIIYKIIVNINISD